MPITQPAKKSADSTLSSTLLKIQQGVTPNLTESLTAAFKNILLRLGVKNLSVSQLDQTANEVALESLRQIFEQTPKIQDIAQITFVVTDSLSQTISAYPQLTKELKEPKEERIFEMSTKEAGIIFNSHNQDLEQIATLGQLLALIRLKNPNYLLQSQIERKIKHFIEKEHPLAQPEVYLAIKNNVPKFFDSYIGSLTRQIIDKIVKKIPTFIELQRAKAAAFEEAASFFEKNLTKYKSQINSKNLIRQLSYILGLLPIPSEKESTLGLEFPQKIFPDGFFGFFVKMLLAPDKNQLQVYYSLLAYERDMLEGALTEINSQLEKLKSQKSKNLRESKMDQNLQKQQRILKNAWDFALSSADDAKGYQSIFQNLSGTVTLVAASQFAWTATESAFGDLPGVYVPKDHLNADEYLAQKIIGGLTYGS